MKERPKQISDTDYRTRIFVAYYLTVGVVLLASLFPENRIWGLNQWAYFSPALRFSFLTLAVLLPLTGTMLMKNKGEQFIDNLDSMLRRKYNYPLLALFITVVMALAFYFLRAKTHFLGDGYMNLASLASSKPLIKVTGFGEVKAHIWLKSLIGDGESAALLSFQIISILSGILFVIVIFYLARKLFENRFESFLFSLGIISGGYMLLSFGYVEYYSLFVLSVAIYSLVGLLIINGKVDKWWVVPLFLLTIFFHVLGITLLPSALYLLFSGTSLERLIQRMNTKTKLILSVIGGIILLSIFTYFYLNSYHFRFAVVPILTDRFTVEGYTIFSLKHIADLMNLLLLHIPGLLVFLVLTPKLSLKENFRQKPFQYLLILTISILGAVFLLDPKLGMPRDWDLFSFCGIPLAIFVYYTILTSEQRIWKYVGVLLMVSLGFLSCFPRAMRQHTPEIAVVEFRTYAGFDSTKNRAGRKLLVDYYIETGDSARAKIETYRWLWDYPENDVFLKVDSLGRANKSSEAILYAKQMIRKNPMYSSSYYAVGTEYLVAGNLDSAIQYLEIANAINPDNSEFLYALGTANIEKGREKIAYEYFRKAIDKGLDSSEIKILEGSYPQLKR